MKETDSAFEHAASPAESARRLVQLRTTLWELGANAARVQGTLVEQRHEMRDPLEDMADIDEGAIEITGGEFQQRAPRLFLASAGDDV